MGEVEIPYEKIVHYYPQEVSSMKYCCLGIFRKEYFRLVTNWCKWTKHTKMLVKLSSKNKKHLRGSTQARINPLAIILTAALRALVSIIA